MLTAVNKLQDITFFPPHPPFILLLFSLPAGVVRFDPCSHILQPRNGARNSAAISASLLLHNNPALRALQETSSLKPLPGQVNSILPSNHQVQLELDCLTERGRVLRGLWPRQCFSGRRLWDFLFAWCIWTYQEMREVSTQLLIV